MTGIATEFFLSLVAGQLPEGLVAYVASMLAERLDQALLAEPACIRLYGDVSARRVLTLKDVGDECLIVSGLLLRRDPPPSYYASLGAAAYGELAGRIGQPFHDLAASFELAQRALRDARVKLKRERLERLVVKL